MKIQWSKPISCQNLGCLELEYRFLKLISYYYLFIFKAGNTNDQQTNNNDRRKLLSSVVFDSNDPEYYHWIALVSIAYVYNLLVCFLINIESPCYVDFYSW